MRKKLVFSEQEKHYRVIRVAYFSKIIRIITHLLVHEYENLYLLINLIFLAKTEPEIITNIYGRKNLAQCNLCCSIIAIISCNFFYKNTDL